MIGPFEGTVGIENVVRWCIRHSDLSLGSLAFGLLFSPILRVISTDRHLQSPLLPDKEEASILIFLV